MKDDIALLETVFILFLMLIFGAVGMQVGYSMGRNAARQSEAEIVKAAGWDCDAAPIYDPAPASTDWPEEE
jgi:hypothetical protein